MRTFYSGGIGALGSLVTSVFGRTGAVVATLNDYAASLIQNDSSVAGATVKLALDNLLAAIPSVPVSSVFARTGAVVATLNDYAASLIQNDSSVAGATVKLALNNLLAAIPSVPVSSVFARTGAVVAALNDYAASLIQNDSSVAGATVKDALNTLLGVTAGQWVFQANWGTAAAPATVAQRWMPRTASNPNGAASNCEYPIAISGTFTFKVTWRVCGTPLTTNTVTIQVFKNGVATGVSAVMAAGAVSGQFSGSVTVAAGDGISVGLLQSSTEAQAVWLATANVAAIV